MSDKEISEGYVRQRFRDLEPSLSDDHPGKAYARYISHAPATPLGHYELTVGSSPVALPSIPTEGRRAVILSLDYDLTFTDDGTNPSDTHGMPVYAGQHFIYDTDPLDSILLYAANDTDVRVAYYG